MSVGEVLLLAALGPRDGPPPARTGRSSISTTTTTGLAVARRTYPDLVTFYAPLDFSWSTRRAVERIRPTVLALVELELWPNLIRAAKRAGAKVAIINARLSARSYRGYRSLRVRCNRRSRRIDVVAAQNAEYARRFVELGIPEDRVSITGSVKYDGLESDRNNARTRELRQVLGLSPTDLVFVAGSTMEGEEAAVLAAYRGRAAAAPALAADPGPAPRRAVRERGASGWSSRARRSSAGAGSASPRPDGQSRRFAAGHPDRHDRRAGGGLGTGRRGLRGREPAARPRAART